MPPVVIISLRDNVQVLVIPLAVTTFLSDAMQVVRLRPDVRIP